MKKLPRPSRLYDAAVFGGDLAALAAGALLAKQGWRVLVVDDSHSGTQRGEGGYLLPQAPALLPEARSNEALRGLLDALGLLPTVGRAIAPYPRGLQVVLPDARLDLFPETGRRAKELSRAFGAKAPSLPETVGADLAGWEELGAKIPPQSLLDRFALRRLEKAMAPVTWSAFGPLAPAVEGLHRLLSADDSSLSFEVTTLPMLLRPSRLPEQRLSELLRGSIVAHRGDRIGSPDAPVELESIEVERGRFAGLRLKGQDEPFLARMGIAGYGAEKVAEMLPASRRQRKVEALGETMEAKRRLVTQTLVLREAALPPGLAELVLWAGEGAEAVLVGVEPACRSNGKEAEGEVAVVAMSTTAPNAKVEDALPNLRRALDELLPFHERHLVFESHRLLGTLDLPAEDGRRIGGLPIRTPLEGLLFANRNNLPAFGWHGAIRTAFRVVERAQELGRKFKALTA